ncbi:hypothetical protein V5035_25465 [Enterobacter ludwigii]
MPARPRKYHDVIHVPHVPQGRLLRLIVRVHRPQTEPCQQRTQRTAPADTPAWRVKLPATLHAVVQVLPHQVQQHRVADVTLKLSHQRTPADMAVKSLYIGPADVRPSLLLQAARHFMDRMPSAPVPFMMLTERVHRQAVVQLHRHPFQDHRILRRPDGHALPAPPDYLHGAQAVTVLRKCRQQASLYSLPVKPQVPDVRIRRCVLTSATAPLKSLFQPRPLQCLFYWHCAEI